MKTKLQQDNWNRSLKGLYAKLTHRAKEGGHTMTLTFEQFCRIRNRKCEYCNDDLPLVGYGIDRVDNNRGYELGNVVGCCLFCNKAKSNRSEDEFRRRIKHIYHNWAKDFKEFID